MKRKNNSNSKNNGGNKKKKVSNNDILQEGLVKLLEEYKDIHFYDTHIHFNLIWSKLPKLDQKRNDKIDVLKNHLFSKNLRNQNKILEHLVGVITIFCEPTSLSPSFSMYKELTDYSEKDGFKIWCAFGIHPHEAKSFSPLIEKNLRNLLKYEKCVALGEIGLDFYYNNSPEKIQEEVFIKQIEIAKEMKKPIIIHTRSAEELTLKILKKHLPKDYKFHVHCFTSEVESFAKGLLEHFENCYIGFTGIYTYNVKKLWEISKTVPLNRLLLESDGPYLPVRNKKYLKKKGKIPSNCCNIPFVGLKLSEVLGMDYIELMKQVEKNTKEMYGI